MAARVKVDAAAGLLRGAGREWPFEVDCRTGTASVELGGGRFELRPLSWREKRNLARFAGAGEGFLERQLLSLSSDRPAAEAAAAARQALVALARWINSPGDTALPLADEVLAQVSLELSVALGSAPLALDDWPAHEVEILWRSAQQAPPAQTGEGPGRPATGLPDAADGDTTRPAPSRWRSISPSLAEPDRGFTRIVVLPDPATRPETEATLAGPSPATGAEAEAPGASPPDPASPGSPPAGPAESPAKRRRNTRQEAAATSGPAPEKRGPEKKSRQELAAAGPRGKAAPTPAHTASSAAPGAPGARCASGRRGETPRGVFRVSLGPAPDAAGDRGGVARGAAGPARPEARDWGSSAPSSEPSPGSPSAFDAAVAGPSWPGAATAALRQPIPALAIPAAGVPAAEPPIEEADTAPAFGHATLARGPWPARDEPRPAAERAEPWLDELAERLAEAAADLGIDLEA